MLLLGALLPGCSDFFFTQRPEPCNGDNTNCIPVDETICDGIDNDGSGRADEGFPDTDRDGIADCVDEETCDGLDNDGDGEIDEGFLDRDSNGVPDCIDVEVCDGIDNNGNGTIDEGFPDTDNDGTADCRDVETCDGLDNDGDGSVDEGFNDLDEDGIADCLDFECDPGVPEPLYDLSGACDTPIAEPALAEIDLEVIWTFKTVDEDTGREIGFVDSISVVPACTTHPGCTGFPIILAAGIPLDDRDIAQLPGRVYALDASTGDLLWRSPPVHPSHARAVPEHSSETGIAAYVYGTTPSIVQLNMDGSLTPLPAFQPVGQTAMHLFAARDISFNGNIEVLMENHTYDPATNTLETTQSLVPSFLSAHFDAVQNRWYRTGRGNVWDSQTKTITQTDESVQLSAGVPLIALDQSSPLFLWTNEDLSLSDRSGKLLRHSFGPGGTRLPCGGDINGDGAVEVVQAYGDRLEAKSQDGTLLWTAPRSDISNSSGCTIFDANGDGRGEVWDASGKGFRVFDGTTGQLLFEDANHTSWTANDRPAIVDLDLDGEPEIVLSNSAIASFGETVYRNGVYTYQNITVPLQPACPFLLDTTATQPTCDQAPFIGPGLNAMPTSICSRPEAAITSFSYCQSSCDDNGTLHIVGEITEVGTMATLRDLELVVSTDDYQLMHRQDVLRDGNLSHSFDIVIPFEPSSAQFHVAVLPKHSFPTLPGWEQDALNNATTIHNPCF